jgi:hypothetical protein
VGDEYGTPVDEARERGQVARHIGLAPVVYGPAVAYEIHGAEFRAAAVQVHKPIAVRPGRLVVVARHQEHRLARLAQDSP